MMTSILVASISSGLISLIFAILLILSSKIFKVDVDRRVSELNLLLPGVNCGSCGFPSCTQFAKALVDDKASVNGCFVGGTHTVNKVAEFLGKIATPQKERTRAYIFCHGHIGISKSNKIYTGVNTCVSVVMAGGNSSNYDKNKYEGDTCICCYGWR